MTIKHKLDKELSGENIIRLYREGIFYIAYNHSALRFKKQVYPDVKLLKHVLKDGGFYLRIGVVQNSQVLSSLDLMGADGSWKDYMELECEPVSTDLLASVPDKTIERKKGRQKEEDTGQEVSVQVLQEIISIDLGNMTPVNAMVRIEDWKRRLNQGIQEHEDI